METTQINHFLSCILKILQMMVESGAEIYRVEESARRMCCAYGAKRVDIYATTSNLILSVEFADDIIKTHTRRIIRISTDIDRLDRLNSLVRRITNEELPLAEIHAALDKIDRAPAYPTAVILFFYSVIAGAFYAFFGGRNLTEMIFSMLIGLVVGIVNTAFGRPSVNKFMSRFACSFLACTAAFALRRAGLVERVDHIIIGNIMSLIPGIGLTNAIRDLFTGDSITGTLRFIEAAMLALSIACGYILTTFLFGGTAV